VSRKSLSDERKNTDLSFELTSNDTSLFLGKKLVKNNHIYNGHTMTILEDNERSLGAAQGSMIVSTVPFPPAASISCRRTGNGISPTDGIDARSLR